MSIAKTQITYTCCLFVALCVHLRCITYTLETGCVVLRWHVLYVLCAEFDD